MQGHVQMAPLSLQDKVYQEIINAKEFSRLGVQSGTA